MSVLYFVAGVCVLLVSGLAIGALLAHLFIRGGWR